MNSHNWTERCETNRIVLIQVAFMDELGQETLERFKD